MKDIKKLFGTRVLVTQKRVTTYGKIVIASNNAEKTKEAVVQMVGDEVTSVELGDKVLFEPFSETVIKEENDTVWSLIKEEDIIGIVGE